MLPFLITAGIGAFVVGIVVMSQRAAKERTESLRAAALKLGWGFRDDVPFDTIPDLDRFELFKQGHSRKLTSLMTSPAGDSRAVVFDYRYTTGGGKSQSTHRQTVFYGVSDGLSLPSFSLRPQNFFHTIAKGFGYQDIDIAERPLFSDMFVLRGRDVTAVRDMISGVVAEFFEMRSGVCASGSTHEVLFWRPGKRVEAGTLAPFIEEGFALVQTLVGNT